MRYFHGGAPGLKRGDMILPPSETGAKCASDYVGAGIHRRDRVYVATDPNGAGMYAAMHPSLNGSIYEVEPVGTLEPDPDCIMPGLSYQVPRARIIRRIRVRKKLLAKARREFLKDGEATP